MAEKVEVFTVYIAGVQPRHISHGVNKDGENRTHAFIASQPGFLGFYITEYGGILLAFKTEQQAQETRLSLAASGCTCGGAVGRMKIKKLEADRAEEFMRRIRSEK